MLESKSFLFFTNKSYSEIYALAITFIINELLNNGELYDYGFKDEPAEPLLDGWFEDEPAELLLGA